MSFKSGYALRRHNEEGRYHASKSFQEKYGKNPTKDERRYFHRKVTKGHSIPIYTPDTSKPEIDEIAEEQERFQRNLAAKLDNLFEDILFSKRFDKKTSFFGRAIRLPEGRKEYLGGNYIKLNNGSLNYLASIKLMGTEFNNEEILFFLPLNKNLSRIINRHNNN